MEDTKWRHFIIKALDFAFQPIVSLHTGTCFAYEALLRHHQEAGFPTIHAVFDEAHQAGVLFKVDSWLKEKAIGKFALIPGHDKVKLFFNLDNRVLSLPDYSLDGMSTALAEANLHPDSVCFEISEQHDFIPYAARTGLYDHYKRYGYRVAIDDFGTGFSGLQLLYHTEPDFVKIDRFFIANIATDSKKRLFVSNVVNLAHTLGITVIAEGVETEKEYYACKQIGCDLVQGFLVQRPTLDLGELKLEYESVSLLNRRDARGRTPDSKLTYERLERVEPVSLYTSDGAFTGMPFIFEIFRKNKTKTFIPVVNTHDEPVGLVRESEIKEYVYSKYGKDLLMNKTFGKSLKDFVVRCPRAEIGTKLEKILEAFASEDNSEGVMLTDDGRYLGFITTKSLLNAIHEKNLQVARDQNPLTKLPGNNLINEYVDQMFVDKENDYVLAYFDFDNFKAYNDKYGFRQGDRAILMFGDILREFAATERFFMGHIGGDDFFVGFAGETVDALHTHETIRTIVEKFRNDALSLYDSEDRQKGYVVTVDRDGKEKDFPLLSVSAVVLTVPKGQRDGSLDDLGRLLARLKKQAKTSADRMAFASIGTIPEKQANERRL